MEAIPPARQRARQVLLQTGLAELLRLPLDTTVVDREDVVHWRHASGAYDLADAEPIGNMLQLQTEQDGIDQSLYRGTFESVANCVEHAYKEHPSRRTMRDGQDGWWAFQQVRDGFMTVCVCDLGIGVANALPIKLRDEPTVLRQLLYLYRRTKGKDSRTMMAAVEYGRSSTGKAHRGKGLHDATSVIDAAGEGVFLWLSHKGLYQYTRESGRPAAGQHTRQLRRSIRGTICAWRFPIKSKVAVLAVKLEQP